MGYLNSDDQLTPWAIQSVLDIFDDLPDVRWITSRFPMQARKDGVVTSTTILSGVDNWGFFNGENVRSLSLPSTGWIVQDCTFWRRDLWEEVGGTFDHALKLAADFELWARFIQKTDLYVVPVPFGIYRVQGANQAMVGREIYRDECVKVLNRYTPMIPEDILRLTERVTSKKLMMVGLGHLIDQAKRPLLKSINYDLGNSRYVILETK